LKGGIACYDSDLKVKLLGVPQELIDTYTPESMEVTREMAYRLKNIIPSDIQVTVTGLNTPGGSETPENLLVPCLFLLICGREACFRKVFARLCEDVIRQTIEATADLLIAASSKVQQKRDTFRHPLVNHN
jgi:nicotinamide-nucleotide amidase